MRLRIYGRVLIIVRHPEHIRHVAVDNRENYTKQTRGYVELSRLVGNGLLTSEGSFWRRQRRIAQPAFHRDRIAAYARSMTRAAREMIRRWQPWMAANQPFDVSTEMMRVTLGIVCEALFGEAAVTRNAPVIRDALATSLHCIASRSRSLFAVPMILPTPTNLRLRWGVWRLDRIVRDLMEDRRSGPSMERGDVLSMLMQARDEETNEGMDDDQLRDEVMTMFLAGHETTAMALTWTLYLLATHPDVESRLRAEVRTALGDRPVTIADFPRLSYLHCVLKESMRLYPPAPVLSRRAINADCLDGYHIPKDASVLISPFISHRNPEFFPNPDAFDPERFREDRAKKLPRMAYIPFGVGQRKCMGESFAMMEAQLVLATIVQHVSLTLVPGHPIQPVPDITLRPSHGMLMRPAATENGDDHP